jgi:allophanate hydrolase subunit 2
VTGRLGYWDVGVPPSGAIDPLSLNVANQLLNNPFNTAGLECTCKGLRSNFIVIARLLLQVVTCGHTGWSIDCDVANCSCKKRSDSQMRQN